MREEQPDILIIGGGVIGLIIARALHKAGSGSIAILEKSRCGEESSWAAAGMLGPQVEANETGPFFDLCCTSRDLYPCLAAELLDETGVDIELERSGTLFVAFTESDVEHIRRRYEWQTAAGLPVGWLSVAETRKAEPSISPEVRDALFFPNDWQVENRKLLTALRRYAELNGIEMLEHTDVTRLAIENGRVIGAETSNATIQAGQTVLATGAWTSLIQLGTMQMPLKVEPVRGQMIAFNTPERPFRHVVYGRGGYIVPRLDGRVLAGSTSEHVGYDASPTEDARALLKQMAARIVPRLAELEIADQWAGLRPFAADGLPVLGAIDGVDGLFIATAHYRNGILLAPITAKLAADFLVGGVGSEYFRMFGARTFSLARDRNQQLMTYKGFLIFSLILFTAFAAAGQSRRVPPSGSVNTSPTTVQLVESPLSVKQMFEEANGYIRAKAAEFEMKKVPFSEGLLDKTKLEQRQLAAKYAAIAGARGELAGDDLYYLGMLHWIAVNLDGTADGLRKFIALPDTDAARRQTARSIVTVVLAKQKKVVEAEMTLAEYLKSEPIKMTERARMEGELAKAYQTQKDFVRMAPHAEEDYKAAKALLKDATSRARGLDEVLDAGMLVFEAHRDLGNRAKADDALEDMRITAAETGSPSFYFYAVDQKMKYLIDTGRKPQALEFYSATLANIDREFSLKELQSDARTRLKKKEKHYKLLGEPAPEFTAAGQQWFPGKQMAFADLKGKVVLLDFWAMWCGPCIEAFPSLIEWKQDFGRDGFEILGVTRYYGAVKGMPADEPSELEHLKRFRTSEGLPYPFVVGSGQAMQLQYGATSLPTAVLIDRKGVVRYIESGTSPSRLTQLREMIVKLLAEK